jgi:hypothetical protein
MIEPTYDETDMLRFGILFGCILTLFPLLYISLILVLFEFVELTNKFLVKICGNA